MGFTFKLHTRSNAIRANIKALPKVKGKLLTIFEESFLIRACKLWNALPSFLAHINVLSSFKLQFENVLKAMIDEPPQPGYPSLNSI